MVPAGRPRAAATRFAALAVVSSGPFCRESSPPAELRPFEAPQLAVVASALRRGGGLKVSLERPGRAQFGLAELLPLEPRGKALADRCMDLPPSGRPLWLNSSVNSEIWLRFRVMLCSERRRDGRCDVGVSSGTMVHWLRFKLALRPGRIP